MGEELEVEETAVEPTPADTVVPDTVPEEWAPPVDLGQSPKDGLPNDQTTDYAYLRAKAAMLPDLEDKVGRLQRENNLANSGVDFSSPHGRLLFTALVRSPEWNTRVYSVDELKAAARAYDVPVKGDRVQEDD